LGILRDFRTSLCCCRFRESLAENPFATGCRPVALIGSTIVAIAMTPVAFWSVRTGARNLWFYGPILWVALAAYIVFVFPKVGYYGQYGLLFLAALGLVVLGFIPAR
jgi:hypothetical protein